MSPMLEPSGELCGSRSLSKTCDRVVDEFISLFPVVAIFSYYFGEACSREVPVAAHHSTLAVWWLLDLAFNVQIRSPKHLQAFSCSQWSREVLGLLRGLSHCAGLTASSVLEAPASELLVGDEDILFYWRYVWDRTLLLIR
jgi:hypothetical protein